MIPGNTLTDVAGASMYECGTMSLLHILELPQLPVRGKTCEAVFCTRADVPEGVALLLRFFLN